MPGSNLVSQFFAETINFGGLPVARHVALTLDDALAVVRAE